MVEGDNYSPQNYQGISQMPPSTTKKSNKIIWIISGVLIVSAIAVLIILLNPFSNAISSDELSFGAYVDLKEAGKVNFEIDEEDHELIIDNIRTNSVEINIESNTITAMLEIGEEKKFELNDEGI